MAEEIRLDCGVRIIIEKNTMVRSAALGIWVASGSMYEDDSTHGVSHFIEHMMFKGTENRSARQIAEDMDKIGATFNAMTGKESTCYYVKTLTSNIYKGAEILIDMVLGSKFDTEELDKERQVILEEIKMVKDTPDDEIYDIISELVNKGGSLEKSVLGTPASLAGIDRARMVEYYRKRYAREGIVVAVAGNFDEQKIIALFDEKMKVLNEKLPPFKKVEAQYKKSFDVRVKDIEQTHLCLAVPGVSYMDDMYYTFVLMSSILGGSMSSRLFQNIREQKGLAYSVSSMNAFNSTSGFFNIYAGIAHENAAKTIKEIRCELERLAEHGVTEEELSIAKEQVKTTYIFSLENPAALMFSLGRNKLLMDRLFSVDESIEKYNAVTCSDILKAAEMVGDLDQYCAAVITGKELNIKELIDESKNQ
ncbi:MAG: insulinase family protein [Clostridiales bacterium]|nr:insulinase family protein [Clostridiales bacterium]MBQ3321735.1 insulinase family protein [Bacillota bacterium]